jgi:membrane fusion protein, multidrug efflux system
MKWLKPITLITLSAILLAACNETNNSADNQEDLITPVEVEAAKIGTLNVEQVFYGRLTPNETTPIIPTRPGEIATTEVENGDEVEEGDVIATTTPGSIAIEAQQDGFIHDLTIKEGTIVTNTNPIGAIVSIDPIKLELHATAEQLALFDKDQQIEVTINEYQAKAEIQYIPITPDESGLYKIEARINNPNARFKPGMIAEAQITESKVSNELIVPTEAVMEENDTYYIYIVENNAVKRIEVKILITQTEQTAITGDIKAGDEVVTKGQHTLVEGSKVEVMKEEQ